MGSAGINPSPYSGTRTKWFLDEVLHEETMMVFYLEPLLAKPSQPRWQELPSGEHEHDSWAAVKVKWSSSPRPLLLCGSDT